MFEFFMVMYGLAIGFIIGYLYGSIKKADKN